MKMVKSLLLGSAAGIVAVAGAQAADLPVKAKPVEYVKVCSLYGAGYYYIPGTDICQKIGGYVRYENSYGYGENITAGPFTTTGGANQRSTGAADYVTRVRAYITQETRQQTAYGTLRTYLNVGVNVDSPATSNAGQSAGGFNANRAFIQIAGFTFGRATSYYDFYNAPATAYFASPSSDAGDGGVTVAAYTAQLGNGLSATLSFEDPATRRQTVGNIATAAPAPFYVTSNPRKVEMPDIVANLRIDQAWGSAQVMGAIHDMSAGYYATTTSISGHPSDTQLGFAVGAGLKVNFPMFGPGDYFQAQVNYANGASKYVAVSLGGSNALAVNGNSFGFGVASDGIFGGAGSAVNMTTSWGINAAYEHFWTPAVRTSLYGSYFRTSYNTAANAQLCAQQGAVFGAAATCNNDYGYWTIGSRSQWNVTKDFYVGLDTIYLRLNTANAGATGVAAASGIATGSAAGVYTVSDQSAWAVRFRAHRDIVP